MLTFHVCRPHGFLVLGHEVGSGVTSKSLVPTVPETLCPESKPLRFLGFLPLSLHGNSGPSAINPVAVGQPLRAKS